MGAGPSRSRTFATNCFLNTSQTLSIPNHAISKAQRQQTTSAELELAVGEAATETKSLAAPRPWCQALPRNGAWGKWAHKCHAHTQHMHTRVLGLEIYLQVSSFLTISLSAIYCRTQKETECWLASEENLGCCKINTMFGVSEIRVHTRVEPYQSRPIHNLARTIDKKLVIVSLDFMATKWILWRRKSQRSWQQSWWNLKNIQQISSIGLISAWN